MKHALAAGLVLAGIAIAGAGCATDVRVDVDPREDFSGFRTWDWLRPGWPLIPSESGVDRGLEALLRIAVERGLRERGFERTTIGRPDFLVAYHVELERELVRRIETPAMQTLSSPHREGGFEVTASLRTLQAYETGTIVLVVVDAVEQQRVWRGVGVRRVRESFRTRAGEVVAEILEHFPAAAGAWF